MAVGDVKVAQDSVANGAGWGIQPPSGEVWQFRDLGFANHTGGETGGWNCNVEMWDGGGAAVYKDATVQVFLSTHGTVMTNSIYLRIKNEYSVSRVVSYSCMEVD